MTFIFVSSFWEDIFLIFYTKGSLKQWSSSKVGQSWKDREPEGPGAPVPFAIHEQDRALIRDNIIDAVVHAPDIIR